MRRTAGRRAAHRARAHRDDVPQNAADPGRRSLKRLDVLGWLCDSTLNATASPPPRSTTPGVLAGPLQDAGAALGKRGERRRVLVAAVLRPEQGEDRQLEVVRVAPEQLADTGELPVGKTERAMELLFRDLRQRPQDSPRRLTVGTLSRWRRLSGASPRSRGSRRSSPRPTAAPPRLQSSASRGSGSRPSGTRRYGRAVSATPPSCSPGRPSRSRSSRSSGWPISWPPSSPVRFAALPEPQRHALDETSRCCA